MNENPWLISGAIIGIVAGIAFAPLLAVPVAVALGVGGGTLATTAIGCGIIATGGATGAVIGASGVLEIPKRKFQNEFETRHTETINSNETKNSLVNQGVTSNLLGEVKDGTSKPRALNLLTTRPAITSSSKAMLGEITAETPSNSSWGLEAFWARATSDLLTTRPAIPLSKNVSGLAPISSLSDELLGSRIDAIKTKEKATIDKSKNAKEKEKASDNNDSPKLPLAPVAPSIPINKDNSGEEYPGYDNIPDHQSIVNNLRQAKNHHDQEMMVLKYRLKSTSFIIESEEIVHDKISKLKDLFFFVFNFDHSIDDFARLVAPYQAPISNKDYDHLNEPNQGKNTRAACCKILFSTKGNEEKLKDIKEILEKLKIPKSPETSPRPIIGELNLTRSKTI